MNTNPADGTIEVGDDLAVLEQVAADDPQAMGGIKPLKEALTPSFPKQVWDTLSAIDVKPFVRKKGKLDFLPWSVAWRELMKHYPESSYEFDEPKMYDNGTGEQWVTVRIVDGNNVMERRWWLPYMTHTNAPAKDITSTQVNATRMRAIVKCLAMCGLGTSLYAGDDLPDETNDATPVSSAPWEPEPKLLEYTEALREIWGDGQDVDMYGMEETYNELTDDEKVRLYRKTEGRGGYITSREKTEWKQAFYQHRKATTGIPEHKPVYNDDGSKRDVD